jgi:hypothetical protein
MLIKFNPNGEFIEYPEYSTVTDFVRKRAIGLLFGIIEGQPSGVAYHLQTLLNLNFPEEFYVESENYSEDDWEGSISVHETATNKLVIRVVRDFSYCREDEADFM